jgi:hypothetical protein
MYDYNLVYETKKDPSEEKSVKYRIINNKNANILHSQCGVSDQSFLITEEIVVGFLVALN